MFHAKKEKKLSNFTILCLHDQSQLYNNFCFVEFVRQACGLFPGQVSEMDRNLLDS